mmetsp:Transcript_21726/g.30694  ORF Transcript_21726/g.30694 Transcript_21726/m.30694 type:complete len:222 (-) Transcript_21726:551-1216(-)
MDLRRIAGGRTVDGSGADVKRRYCFSRLVEVPTIERVFQSRFAPLCELLTSCVDEPYARSRILVNIRLVLFIFSVLSEKDEEPLKRFARLFCRASSAASGVYRSSSSSAHFFPFFFFAILDTLDFLPLLFTPFSRRQSNVCQRLAVPVNTLQQVAFHGVFHPLLEERFSLLARVTAIVKASLHIIYQARRPLLSLSARIAVPCPPTLAERAARVVALLLSC